MNFGKRKVKNSIVVVVVSVIVAITLVASALPYVALGAKEDSTVIIYPNMSNDELADSLEAKLGDGYGGRLATIISILGVDLNKRAGAYAVESGMSPLTVARHIRNGRQCGVKLTFNNLRTKEQFAERVSSKFMMSKDDMLMLLNDSVTCAKFGKTPETIVAILIPDSYEFYWNVTPMKLLTALDEYYNKFWNDERKAKATALGLQPDEVTTVASIVEEETAKSDERGKVARLYMNRLDIGMMLQADPTVKYAIGDFSIKRITKDMLTTNSPYNTYKFLGLPPGPIRMPDKTTIDAVLNAPQHNFTYMCAKEDFSGYHNFTTTYSEHLANAAKYQAELNKRGIK